MSARLKRIHDWALVLATIAVLFWAACDLVAYMFDATFMQAANLVVRMIVTAVLFAVILRTRITIGPSRNEGDEE